MPEVDSSLLHELIEYLRDNRTELREEWVKRITQAQLLGVMTPEEIFSEVTAVYDWDSLDVDYESMSVGGAAKAHTAEFSRPWRPSIRDALAFVDEYERARAAPFTEEERAAVHARIAYSVAYTARCEHALAAGGSPTFVTRAREALPEFARELLP